MSSTTQVVRGATDQTGSSTTQYPILLLDSQGRLVTGGTAGTAANGSITAVNPVETGARYNSTQPTYATGQLAENQADSAGSLKSVNTPSPDASIGIVPVVTPVASSSLVAKAAAGNLYEVSCTAGATAGYLMVFDSATAVADGTVTPLVTIPVAANAAIAKAYTQPMRFTSGIRVHFSSTGPFSKTDSATAFISAMVK